MKKSLLLSLLLFFMFGNIIFAESQNHIDWGMAVLKYDGIDYESFSPHRPISMENGDEYYIYLTLDSPGYAYILKEFPDRTSRVVFSGLLQAENPIFLMDGDDDFVIPSGSGIIRFHVVVSSSPRPMLEQNRGARLSGAQHNAVIDEIQAINRSISTIAEAPERPERMGGGTRGGGMTVFRYGGQDSYVRTVVIRH